MEKMITLEIPQSDWEKLKEELIRMVAVMQERQRESDERWQRIDALDAEYERLMQTLRKERRNVAEHLDLLQKPAQL
jgi:septal ring factor EnvC (AmiA/AmiB activator)